MSQGGGVVGAASGVDLGALIRDRFEVLRTRRGLELALGTPGSQWQRSLVSAAEEDDAPVLVPLPPAGGFDEDAEDTATGPRGPGPFPSTKRLGLNNLHDRTYEFDTSSGSVGPQVQYGNDGDPLEDSGRNLGARVVRHIGGLDLLWSSLAPRGTISSNEELLLGASVPASGSTPSLADLVHDRPNPLRGALNADLFAAMLTDAHDAGLKVILTLLTYGGGSSQTSAHPAGSGWELCRDGGDTASALAPPDLDVDGTLSQVLRLDWKEDHRGATLDGNPFPTDGTVAGAACDFHEEHLDVSSSYKRSFVAEYAEHVGTLLSRVNGLLPVPLSDILEAVELFNEVDTRNYYETDGRRGAEWWGRAHAQGAWALRQALDAESDLADVRLLLPGVAGYQEGASAVPHDWSNKLDFVEEMVDVVVDELTNELGAEPDEVEDHLQGLDYHWYHRGDGLRHIAYLAVEVRELKDAVARGWAGADVPITVFESGVSALLTGSGDDRPPWAGSSWSAADQEAFQAREVWRRLGGALASPAVIAGWNAWMSGAGGHFTGMGLRVDDQASPVDAYPRPSYQAYQGLASALGDKVVSGRVVNPAVTPATTRVELAAILASPAVAHGELSPHLVVFEYELDDPGFGYAYLVLRDPTDPDTSVAREVTVDYLSAAGAVEEVATEPTSVSAAPSSMAIPEEQATWASNAAMALPRTLSFEQMASPPRLLLSTVPLDFAGQALFSGAALEGSRAYWEALVWAEGFLRGSPALVDLAEAQRAYERAKRAAIEGAPR